ncbi:hypothetical protein SUGI_0650550 [Cryptomeria japonica]|nr:hypothetical protein SUGI_0650550 [Cryptomeria japonica]
MDISSLPWSSLLLTAASLILFLFLWTRESSRTRPSLPLPLGPPAWPIVGNLFQLGKRPHESLYALSHKYRPLMSLRQGMKITVVASSPAMAKDHLLTGRMVIEAAKSLSHHKSSLAWGEYGPY